MGKMLLVLFLAVFGVAPLARATMIVDFDATVFQDSLSGSATTSHSKTIYDVGAFAPITSKETLYLGAIYAIVNSTDKDASSTTTSFSHGDVILGLKWFMDKDKVFSVTLGYGVRADGSYDNGGSSEKWRGTSTYAKITAAPTLKRLSIGMSMIYSGASFSEKNVSGATTNVSYSQTVITPALDLGWSF